MTLDLEPLGRIADRIDNVIAAEALPIPATLAKEARIASLTEIRNDLRSFYVIATGVDPWKDEL